MTTSDHREKIPIANPQLGSLETKAVTEVLDSGSLAAGEQVERFESSFGAFCQQEHAVATSNGTTALHAALEALGIGEGDRVLTTPFTFIATANAIKLAGAEPVFADIDPETYNLDPDRARERIEALDGEVDALLVVHLYGHPAEMAAFDDLAAEYDLAVIEDAAQAHGATYGGDPVGSLGDVACFSFYPTKNMTTGEGGMIVTDDDSVARRARQFINHGRNGKYVHERVGHNFRMTDIAAAIGRVQLDRLPGFLRSRRENAAMLQEGIADTAVQAPIEQGGSKHAYHQFTVRCQRRDELIDHLDEFGIDSGVYYPTPVHEQPAYDHRNVSAPVAEQAAENVLSLPVHPALDESDIKTVIAAVEYFDSYV